MSEELTPEQRAEKLQSVVVATVEFDTGHKLSTSQSELVTEQATKHIRAAVDAERERSLAFVNRFIEDFETDWVSDGEIVDDPDSYWGALTGLYQAAKEHAVAIRKGEPI